MKAVIMAGGLGARLKPLTQILPKPLLPVGEKSVLEITIHKLGEQGFKEIFLAVRHRSDLFQSYFGDGSKFGLKIRYSKEKKRLGTAGPLLLIKRRLKESFLVLNGDILTNMDFKRLKEFHLKKRADLTLVTKKIQLPLHYGVVTKKGYKILHIREKPIVESEINAGIYFLNPEILDFIPPDKKSDMTELIKILVRKKRNVVAYPLEEYWLDIGQMKDYRQAQEDFKNGLI